ncbi:hypothetical protein [Methylobacterium planeticum]|uniref:Uncharacterized protein n=1 Tax=Methylobacterium planeticum TaxID=2615211 RepID=A0A6N6MRG5_9HYPH|nr:hypothetical protein [Methylobacterium planeticum]KAB1071170.1 hypothetical protein F6X51_19945 [Methylobacterium planeticum]
MAMTGRKKQAAFRARQKAAAEEADALRVEVALLKQENCRLAEAVTNLETGLKVAKAIIVAHKVEGRPAAALSAPQPAPPKIRVRIPRRPAIRV